MLRRCTAAAAEICGACFNELRGPACEVLRSHGEDGFSVDEFRKARVRLNADGFICILSESFYDREKLLRAKGAVYADNVRAKGVKCYCRRLRVCARDCSAVLAVGKLADDRKVRGVLCGDESRTCLLYINGGFYENIIRAAFGKGGSLLVVVFVCFLEIKVAKGLDKTSRRTHRTGDFGFAFHGFLCSLYRGNIDFTDLV